VTWLHGSGVVHINEVGLRRARLVLRWVTVFIDMPYWCVASHSGQLSLLPPVGREMSTSQGAVLSGRGNHRCGIALAVHHRLCAISASVQVFYGLRLALTPFTL